MANQQYELPKDRGKWSHNDWLTYLVRRNVSVKEAFNRVSFSMPGLCKNKHVQYCCIYEVQQKGQGFFGALSRCKHWVDVPDYLTSEPEVVAHLIRKHYSLPEIYNYFLQKAVPSSIRNPSMFEDYVKKGYSFSDALDLCKSLIRVSQDDDLGRLGGFSDSPYTDSPLYQDSWPEVPPWITESPITESPITESPITESPIIDSPITDSPITDSPITDSPYYTGSPPATAEQPNGSSLLPPLPPGPSASGGGGASVSPEDVELIPEEAGVGFGSSLLIIIALVVGLLIWEDTKDVQ